MHSSSHNESIKIKKLVDMYNMVANLFWSILNLTPISIFCYTRLNAKMFYGFLILSLLTIILPKSFFNRVQLGKKTIIYKRIGINFFNRFTQNGTIINRIIRKKYPHYKIVSAKGISIRKIFNQTYMFENFHFMMYTFFVLVTMYACWKNYWLWAFIITATNTIYNIYPALLQQYIRVRLTSSIQKVG